MIKLGEQSPRRVALRACRVHAASDDDRWPDRLRRPRGRGRLPTRSPSPPVDQAPCDGRPDRPTCQDRSRRATEEFADRVDVPDDRRFAGFDAYRHAIDCLRPGDVAMLTAYSYCRPVQIEYAVKKGVNVFMEKCFESDPAGFRRILAAGEAAKKRNIKIAAGLQCRHSIARQMLIEKIRAGELGDIPLVRATRDCGRNFLAKPPAGADLVAWQINNRVHVLWAGSGLMLELLIPDRRMLLDQDGWPVSATGKCTREQAGQLQPERHDYVMEYTFADGGKAVVEDRSVRHVHPRQQARQFSGNVRRHGADHKGQRSTRARSTGPRETAPGRPRWKDFLEAIHEDRPYNDRTGGLCNLAGIRAAAAHGRTITWKEMLASNFRFSPIVDQLKLAPPRSAGPWEITVPIGEVGRSEG